MAFIETHVLEIFSFIPFALLGLGIIYSLSYVIYNIFHHPLHIYPGPKLWAATQLPYTAMFLSGKGPYVMSSLHEKYGDIVRVAPNKLSYTDPDAWHDIKGHRKVGHGENGKDQDFFFFSQSNILGGDRENHARWRRALSHGFSAKTMQAQEPLIKQYVDLLIQQLQSLVQKNDHKPTSVNMVEWLNFATFDIIGDLAFGQPFGCLADSKEHPWVEALFNSVKQFAMLVTARWYMPGWIATLRKVFGLGRPQQMQAAFAAELIDKRMKLTTSRPDFVDTLTSARKDDALALTRDEMINNLRFIVLAGSETTATALSGAVFYLCKHSEIQKRLADEVRGSFGSETEMNMHSVSKLRYMLAVLDETLRIYPPTSTSLPRTCQPGGDIICGRLVPGGTTLDVSAWAMTHSSRNFTAPNEFIPERWAADKPRFPDDRREASKPFSVGPRNCIGKNLAYLEMRLILARLVWNFDMEYDNARKAESWIDQKSFNLWLKGPLDVKLVPVKRA